MKKGSLLFFTILLVLTGCGYRPGLGELPDGYKSISVPYVVGDQDGSLTAAIVREVSSSLNFDHSNTGGELILAVELIDVVDQDIGFGYEQVHKHEYKNSIIPLESRMIATVEVSLVDAATQCTVIPKVRITEYVDFDHEYNATYKDSTKKSLGQLSDADAAFAAAKEPLNRLIAKKVVEYITFSQNTL